MLEELPAVVFITVHMVVVCGGQSFITFHYYAVPEKQRYCFTIFSIIPACDRCGSTEHEAAQYDHKTLIQYSIDALTLLKLQVFLGKESLQCGHILSPRMFKS